MRLGKRERALKRETLNALFETNRINPPKKPLTTIFGKRAFGGYSLNPDNLKLNTHTQGISVGQRKYSWQKPGSY